MTDDKYVLEKYLYLKNYDKVTSYCIKKKKKFNCNKYLSRIGQNIFGAKQKGL
jgi:thiaminase